MEPRSKPVISSLVLLLVMLACANPLGTPFVDQSSEVGTIVASTMQALTEQSEQGPPITSGDLLPNSLYFLANDSAQFAQVHRLERDGKTIRQITFEPAAVESFDVSRLDGSVVYVAENRIYTIGADGSGRMLVLDGDAQEPQDAFLNNVNSPIWSPDGKTIAYGYHGLNFYSVVSGTTNRVLENSIDTSNNFTLPRELYWPYSYAADGTKLIVTLGYFESFSYAIYYPEGNALVRFSGDQAGEACCDPVWSADGNSFHLSSYTVGMLGPGLWRVDAATGTVTTLLAGDPGNDTFNLAGFAYLAPDGGLYFFYDNPPATEDFFSRAPLEMTQAGPDGTSGRRAIRTEAFNMINEALWAPDANFVIAVIAPTDSMYRGGEAGLFYADGRPSVPLLPFATQLKWGT